MTEKSHHLRSQQMDSLIQEAHDHIFAELPERYEGVPFVQEKIAALRESLRQVLAKEMTLPIAFQVEFDALCKNVQDQLTIFTDSVRNAEIPAELKDFVVALVKSQRNKIRQVLAEKYEFEDESKDIFAVAEGRMEDRRKVADFFVHRIDIIFMNKCLELSRELKIMNYISMGESRMIDIAMPNGVDRRLLKRLRRYNAAVAPVVSCADGVVSAIDALGESRAQFSFEQFRALVLKAINDKRKFLTGTADQQCRSNEYACNLLTRIESVFRNLTQDGFVNYTADKMFRTVGQDFLEEYRRLVSASQYGAPSVSPDSDSEVSVDVQPDQAATAPALDDLETQEGLIHVSTPELDERIRGVLSKFEALPTPQRFSYIRHEMKALQHILEDRNCYDPKLVLFALLRLEDFMESAQVILKGKAVTTKPDEERLAGVYSRVFAELVRPDGNVTIPSMVEESVRFFETELGILGSSLEALGSDIKIKREAFQCDLETMGKRLSALIEEHNGCDRALAQLKPDLQRALADDNFEELQSLSAKSQELKKKAAELKAQWVVLESEIGALRGKREQELGQAENERRSLEAVNEQYNARMHSLGKSLAALVEQSRSEDLLTDSPENISS